MNHGCVLDSLLAPGQSVKYNRYSVLSVYWLASLDYVSKTVLFDVQIN